MRTPILLLAGLLLLLVIAGCAAPCVEVYHSPVIAKASEPVTFTATTCGSLTLDRIEVVVNGSTVKTCTGVAPGNACLYTGGPYSSYQGSTVSYSAKATATVNQKPTTIKVADYFFAITDNSYGWSKPAIPARRVGDSSQKIDFIFHRADDYASVDAFIDDVEFKIANVFAKQDIVRQRIQLDKFNFYVYSKAGKAANCGTVHADTATDIPWRNVDAVLHVANLGDCTIDSHFSAEGSNTKAFLHEAGHAVWGLADEYDGCGTYYFQPPAEPNIFDVQNGCTTEQTAKGRDPNACYEFTSCQGGWWGIHPLDGSTVMQTGMVGQSWGIEGRERVEYVFNHAPPYERLEGVLPGVAVVDLEYADGTWQPGPVGVTVLPCQAPTPHLPSSAMAPTVRVADRAGETLYVEGFYIDPRIVLWENPQPDDGPPVAPFDPEGPTFLTETSIQVAVPIVRTAETFEFYDVGERMERGEAATVTIPIGDAIRGYRDALSMMEEFPCQHPDYRVDALP